MPTAVDPTRNSHTEPYSSLSDFFKRPIQVATYSWIPGTALGLLTLNPWDLFFKNPRVINRIANYQLATAKLMVKVVLNGNGFYHGCGMIDYLPFEVLDPVTSTSTTFYGAIGASQRLKLLLDPTTSSAGIMEIPFIYNQDALPLTTNNWSDLGVLHLREIASLQHSNGSVQPITITVFVWAEDVQLTHLTSINPMGMVIQASEVEESVTTKVSSAVAQAAGALSSVPTIAPMALATSMVATTVGEAARLYGFSRPSGPAEPSAMRPKFMGPLAVTDAGDSLEKLSVTGAQQTTVDPRVIGINAGDELCISDIAGRESLFGSISWSSTASNGTLLYNYRVQPFAMPLETTTFHPTACAFASHPFEFWRGTMRYRFMFCNSAYHRGKVRITWDPNYCSRAGEPELNVALSRIVDLEVERDVTIDIPWGASTTFLSKPVALSGATGFSSSTRYTSGQPQSNGVLSLHVQNNLTSSGTAATAIAVLVFVSCPDLCVAVPNEYALNSCLNVFSGTVQSSEEEDASESLPPTGQNVVSLHSSGCPPSAALVYFGEEILSFRQLLKRYVAHSTFYLPSMASGWAAIVNPDFPQYKGYSARSIHLTTTGKKFNFVKNTLLHYLAPAFLACRGGHRVKYVVSSTSTTPFSGCMTIHRSQGGVVTFQTVYGASVLTSPATFARSTLLANESGFPGAAVTPISQQPVIEAELPYYRQYRFEFTKDINMSTDGLGNLSHVLRIENLPGTAGTVVTRYHSVAEDFNLSCFTGAPPMIGFNDAALPAAALT